ncbi:PREDICTED: uncharacterized protein LOC108546052 [Eufriesea mexicana]|uniref:uncharacterized protein LOC108546052 n=1 Tax=Eufriesea mexicana TaxID=516756 RepID=UPI00083C57F7|nr:PREDICTED: uncharacterized protein LOC108546052 [Eufriesea mexicana]
MKFAVAMLVFLAAAIPLNAYQLPATGSGALANEMQDFVDILPVDDIVALSKAYATQDEQFRAVMAYLGNTETKEWVQFFEAEPKFISLMNYVQNNGLDIYYLINKLNGALRIPPLVQKLRASLTISKVEITGGLDGFLSDLGRIIPLEEILNMFTKKLEHSKVVKDLTHEITSNGFPEFYFSIFNNEHYKRLVDMVATVGVDREVFLAYTPLLLSTFVIVT